MRSACWWVALVIVAATASCVLPGRESRLLSGEPAGAPTSQDTAVASLAGQVDLADLFGREGRPVQASMGEIARAATVALIDAETFDTIATTVTTASGSFVLDFGRTFAPAARPYFLEAVKGLSVGGKPNRAGAPAARIRTLVGWSGGAWNSLTGPVLYVSRTTTALAVLASLRDIGMDASAMMGKLAIGTPDAAESPPTPDTFTPAAGISNAEFHAVFGLIDLALGLDQDPFAVVVRSPASGKYERVTAAPRILDIIPAEAEPGQSVTLHGHDFDPDPEQNIVRFNGARAMVDSVSADRSSLVAEVPSTALSGFVELTLDYVTAKGPYFKVVRSASSAAPLAANVLYGVNAASVQSHYRIAATAANTSVTIEKLTTSGAKTIVATKLLAQPGSSWDFGVAPQIPTMYKIVATAPILGSWDTFNYNITANVTYIDDLACQTGTDYYLGLPPKSATLALISHSDGNNVQITPLTDPSNGAVTLALDEGEAYVWPSDRTMPTAETGYYYRIKSDGPTTALFGNPGPDDNYATQVYSGDMRLYYLAFPESASTKRTYHLVGWEDNTTVTLHSFNTGTTVERTINRGQLEKIELPAPGVERLRVLGSQPFGLYLHVGYDSSPVTGMFQHSSADNPGAAGKRYHVVAQTPRASHNGDPVNVFILSLADNNAVTLQGGINGGPYGLARDAWFNAGGLPSGQVLNLTASQPVLVWTAGGYADQKGYTLVPTQ